MLSAIAPTGPAPRTGVRPGAGLAGWAGGPIRGPLEGAADAPPGGLVAGTVGATSGGRLAADVLVRSPRLATAPADSPVELTDEERRFLAAGTLGQEYPALKARMAARGREAAIALGRAGLIGPFSRRFGDPIEMLESARRLERHAELMRLAKDVRRGDILVTTWNSRSDFISDFTRGPFTHALLCVKDGPAPEFIEAIGATAPDDPAADIVRRTSFADETWDGQTFRLIRPTAGLPEPARRQAIDKAVAFAERQLGKPYDYTFSDADRSAFYCSELAALSYTVGAGLGLAISKDPGRDGVIVALSAIADALGPRDRQALATKIFHKFNRADVTSEKLAQFVVAEILPHCRVTEKLGKSEAERQAIAAAIVKVMEGKAFPRFEAALASGRGRFDLVRAAWSDTRALLAEAQVNGWQAFQLGRTLLLAVLPHSEPLTSFIFGKGSEQAKAATRVLDQLEAGRAAVRKVPLIGRLLARALPGRASGAIKRDFTSPTDLAWALGVHKADYNVKPGHPLDPETYQPIRPLALP